MMLTRHEAILYVGLSFIWGGILGLSFGHNAATTRITNRLVQEELATKHASDVANMRTYEQLQADTKKRVQAWIDNAAKE